MPHISYPVGAIETESENGMMPYMIQITCSYTFFTGRRSRSSAVVSGIRNEPSGVEQKDIECVFNLIIRWGGLNHYLFLVWKNPPKKVLIW